MVIVCLHPQPTEQFMRDNMSKFKKGCILTDVCGIKGQMTINMTKLAAEHGVNYVGTHPMQAKSVSVLIFQTAHCLSVLILS